jgi:hypothetical protein
MERFAREARARELAVDCRAATARAVQILQDQHCCAFPNVHPGAIAAEWTARLGIHQLQRVEAAERQPREGVGTAGQRRIETTRTDRVGGLADRDRARRTGGDDARAKTGKAEAGGDDVDGRATEVIPGVRRAGILDPAERRGVLIGFVAKQIGGPGAEQHADALTIATALEQPGIGQCLGRGRDPDLIAA